MGNGTPFPKGRDRAPEQGVDYAAVLKEITVGGVSYHLAFTNRTFRYIEDVYREQYGRIAGLPQVLAELEAMSLSAVMAVFYAAILAGENESAPDWDTYEQQFRMVDLPKVADTLIGMVDRAMPDEEPGAKNA